jgi:DNA-binding MarR family transcriptional regulator
MDNKITSYIPLLEAWETFLKKRGNHDLSNFAQWLIETEKEKVVKPNSAVQLEKYFDKNSAEYNYSFQSSEAAFLIWRLSKFIRHYVKPILVEKGLSSQDDFAILAHIDYLKTCSKKEAVEANIIEPTTGIEIIKRLVKQKLILEKENKEDKRQKLVSLTKKGQDLLKEIYIGFSGIQDVLADMKTDERLCLIDILKRLDSFHTSNIKYTNK